MQFGYLFRIMISRIYLIVKFLFQLSCIRNAKIFDIGDEEGNMETKLMLFYKLILTIHFNFHSIWRETLSYFSNNETSIKNKVLLPFSIYLHISTISVNTILNVMHDIRQVQWHFVHRHTFSSSLQSISSLNESC